MQVPVDDRLGAEPQVPVGRALGAAPLGEFRVSQDPRWLTGQREMADQQRRIPGRSAASRRSVAATRAWHQASRLG